ncbi:SAM-dependent methyltransferase [Parabacteroides sp. PF5-9]|uniref:SAM-dependent methyltransferase n=1 Tax=Parabacteroides sp. PF5-9 TaxID=1742404 RepID=UPI002474E86C|nr:SAM-dependent methyltransferase [Parabacteroides sp. PF5-9]MDH6358399.1 putative O-methyltransferase YrrM [Parabacteroides sp. PF5-9]
MRLFPQKSVLYKGSLLYRRIRHRHGHGVHSPFVFNLITKVIREKSPYYSFQEIELLRKKLRFQQEMITYKDRKHPNKTRSLSVGKLVEREAISPKYGALLFRLTNYFQSKHILQLGGAMGISTLYLTTYATDLRCVVLEDVEAFADVSRKVFDEAAHNPIDLRVGVYNVLLPRVISEMKTLDFVFFNIRNERADTYDLFTACLKAAGEQTVFVFDGIKSTPSMRKLWKQVCDHPEVSVTVDLFSLGIVFFNKKLHKRNYIVYF